LSGNDFGHAKRIQGHSRGVRNTLIKKNKLIACDRGLSVGSPPA
jgi:hypothetical protein